MYKNRLKEMETISQAVGNHPEYVQGGGGNTSVKLDDERMAIKASGYQLKQITDTEGFVVIQYNNIKKYYDNVILDSSIDFEKDSVKYAKNNIIEMEGIKTLRPSVEAGFHSVLKKYVIHTHPVYANILCCSEEGNEVADKIFVGKDYEFLWIPYINPGFSLTLKIKNEIEQYVAKNKMFPEIIFMQNHGLIVSCDDYDRCIDLHTEVNATIKQYLRIEESYPEIVIDKIDESTYKSNTGYLMGYFKNNIITQDYFDKYVLYPDQLVYMNGCISLNKIDNKLNINIETDEATYNTNGTEARTIEETLLAYLYVIDQIQKNSLTLKTMTEAERDFIKNWESEKYRKSLLENSKCL